MADTGEMLCCPDLDASRAKPKPTFLTGLLCLWFTCFYLTTWGSQSQEFIDSASLEYVTTFRLWLLNILSVLFDSLVIFVAVFAFAYHHRGRHLIYYIIVGLLCRYLLNIAVLLYFVSASQIIATLREHGDFQQYLLGGLVLLGTIVASCLATSYARNTPYCDERDEQLGYILGVGKKWWALLLFAFRPVIVFTTRLSVVLVYQIAADISSAKYWKDSLSCSCSDVFADPNDYHGGLTGVLVKVGALVGVWGATLGLFGWGVNSIADKTTSNRAFKISLVFVLVPVLILVIPIIRNRTWCF